MTAAGWGIAGNGFDLRVEPGASTHIRARVVLAEAYAELGPVVRRIEVAESGVRTFTVPWHQHGDRTVAANPVGGNQVSWPSSDAAFPELSISAADRFDVHVRFVLRHLTTTLLAGDLGGRSIHAVTATLPGGGVLAVAGATRSGKTRLIHHFAAAGLVGEMVDDDCPVLASDGSLATLIPRYDTKAVAVRSTLAALILLTPDGSAVRDVTSSRAEALLADTPVPWPAPWLPAPDRTAVPMLPDIPMIEVPAQDTSAFDAVTQWVRATC